MVYDPKPDLYLVEKLVAFYRNLEAHAEREGYNEEKIRSY
jgi:hypothetical protein